MINAISSANCCSTTRALNNKKPQNPTPQAQQPQQVNSPAFCAKEHWLVRLFKFLF